MRQFIHIFILLFSLQLSLYAQSDFQEGFDFLEQGKFEQAVTFFGKEIQKNPTNKTAKLCYARAIGLSDNPEQAEVIFREMLTQYPDDFELELNLAESFMWQKKYVAADSLYQFLVEKKAENFVANLGAANAATNLKKHQNAINSIEKALLISPENENAKISKKYIYLAAADDWRAKEFYNKAHAYLDEIDVLFPNDKDILLTKAVVFLNEMKTRSAMKIYLQLIDNQIALVQAHNGKSYCHTLLQEAKEARQDAELSVGAINENTAKNIAFDAKLNYLNTLALNQKFAKAHRFLGELRNENPDNPKLDLAEARLAMWQWKFTEALFQYETLIENEDSLGASLQLEYADALRSVNRKTEAIAVIEKVLAKDSTLTDARRLLGHLKRQQRSQFESQNYYATDVGGNQSFQSENKFIIPHNDRHTSTVGGTYRKTWNKLENEIAAQEAAAFSVQLGHIYQPHYRLKLSAEAGLYSFQNTQNHIKNNLQIRTGANYSISKWQQIEAAWLRENFDYNAILIRSEIQTDNLILNHHIYSPWKIGWYTQYMFTLQSDENQRHLVYSALYYNILQVPILKVGLTFNWFSYEEQQPALYFSPENFQGVAFFAQFHNLDKSYDKLRYQIMASVGSQRIDANDRQATQLLDLKLGYDFGHRFLLMAHYMYSSAAQQNIAGFSFHQIGLKGRYIF